MALTFYYGSGSPFAWKVWLTLEHKQLPYELRLLSFDQGDTEKPEFLALSPRGKVPTLVDEGFALWESSAILEYLEERFPTPALLPKDAKTRAVARRIANEADSYLYPAQRRLFELTVYSQDGDAQAIELAKEDVSRETSRFERYLTAEYFAGALSLADFTVYPIVALLQRLDVRRPEHSVTARFGEPLRAWSKRIESLPYFAKTVPPHWKG
jgi:glutathione S-transferase